MGVGEAIESFLASRGFLLLATGFFLTGVVGTFIGHALQKRHWRYQQVNLLRQTELEAATQLFESISRLLDKRLYRMRQILYGLRTQSGAVAADRVRDYREVLFEWNDAINRNLSMVQRYFGRGMRHELETQVFSEFRKLGSAIEREYLKESPDAGALSELHEELNKLNAQVYVFDMKMLFVIEANADQRLSNPYSRSTKRKMLTRVITFFKSKF